MELVEEDDHQRLQTVLQSAKEMAQQQGGVRVRPGHGGLEEM